MANLSVRKLDEEVYQLLRVRAAKHGVSMEEEARQIICKVVTAPERISDIFRKYFGQEGVNLNVPKRVPHDPVDFDQ